jgi:hypothetical protein
VRNTGVRERNRSITIKQNQSSSQCENCGMGTSSSRSAGEIAGAGGRGVEVTCRRGVGIPSLLTWSGEAGAKDTYVHLGTTTGDAEPRKWLGGHSGGTEEDKSDRSRWTTHTV